MPHREDPFGGRLPRVAVIGRLPGYGDGMIECVGACEADGELRERYKARGLDVYEPQDADKLIERDDVDIVLIQTPNNFHAEAVLTALAAGKHVMVQKPLAVTHEEIDGIVEARRKSGKEVQVHLQLRNSFLYVRVKEIIAELDMHPVHAFYNVRDYNKVSPENGQKVREWRMHKELSGGYLLEKMCHYVDLCNWWIDRPVEKARTFAPPIITSRYDGIMDSLCLNLLYAGGATAALHWTQFAGHDQDYAFGVVAPEGSINCRFLERGTGRMEITVCDSVRDELGKVIYNPLLRRENYSDRNRGELAHDSAGCMREFIRYLRGQRETPTISFEDAVHTMRVCLAGEESAVLGEDATVRRN